MKIKFEYNPTEREKDIIAYLQGYLGILIFTYIGMFHPWGLTL